MASRDFRFFAFDSTHALNERDREKETLNYNRYLWIHALKRTTTALREHIRTAVKLCILFGFYEVSFNLCSARINCSISFAMQKPNSHLQFGNGHEFHSVENSMWAKISLLIHRISMLSIQQLCTTHLQFSYSSSIHLLLLIYFFLSFEGMFSKSFQHAAKNRSPTSYFRITISATRAI